jgi:hypothetical protein
LEAVVIGLLAAGALLLLIPAVLKYRNLGQQTGCQDNLRRIGEAFKSHHNVHGFFPSGGWEGCEPPTYINGQPAVGSEQKAGWGFQILPYVGGEGVWKGVDAGTEQERILRAVGTPNRVFFCPTRREPQTVSFRVADYLNGVEATHVLCDYAASNWENTGAVGRREPLSLSDLTDGPEFTLLVADKRLNLAFLGQRQPDDGIGYTAGWCADTIRSTDRPPAPDYSGVEGQDGELLFGSSHSGGIYAVFADGSGRKIAYAIDRTVFQRLGNRSDEPRKPKTK